MIDIAIVTHSEAPDEITEYAKMLGRELRHENTEICTLNAKYPAQIANLPFDIREVPVVIATRRDSNDLPMVKVGTTGIAEVHRWLERMI